MPWHILRKSRRRMFFDVEQPHLELDADQSGNGAKTKTDSAASASVDSAETAPTKKHARKSARKPKSES